MESSSVREGFTDLLRQHDGIAGLLDMEGEARVFWWKGRVLDSLVAGSSYWPLEKIEEDLELMYGEDFDGGGRFDWK